MILVKLSFTKTLDIKLQGWSFFLAMLLEIYMYNFFNIFDRCFFVSLLGNLSGMCWYEFLGNLLRYWLIF